MTLMTWTFIVHRTNTLSQAETQAMLGTQLETPPMFEPLIEEGTGVLRKDKIDHFKGQFHM